VTLNRAHGCDDAVAGNGTRRNGSDIRDAVPGSTMTRLTRPGLIAATAIVTTGAYVGFLAWDTKKTLGTDGQLHGPYDAWQVIGVVGVLFALAVAGGKVNQVRPVATTSAVVMAR